MKGRFLVFVLASILVSGFVVAQSDSAKCSVSISNVRTLDGVYGEIPSLDSQLQDCPTEIPPALKKLIKNGVFWLEITDGDDLYVTISGGKATSVKIGTPEKYDFKSSMDSCVADTMLQKQNIAGAFVAFYKSGKANLGASGFVNKIKLFFGKMFIKADGSVDVSDACVEGVTKNQDSTGEKPENCDDTFMQGHEEYQFAQEEWDRRLAETGDICQTQTNKRPVGCIYLFEQIKGGQTRWLCWY